MKNYLSIAILLLLYSNLTFSTEIKIFIHKIPEHFQSQIIKNILFVDLDNECLDKILDSFVIEGQEKISYSDLESANTAISQSSTLNIFSCCERRSTAPTKKFSTIDNANKFHEFRFPPLVTKNGDTIKIRVFQFQSFTLMSVYLKNKIIKSYRKDSGNVDIKDIKLLGSWAEALFILFTNFELVYIPMRQENPETEYKSKKIVNFTRSLPKSAKNIRYHTIRLTISDTNVFGFVDEDSNTIIEFDLNEMRVRYVVSSVELQYWGFKFQRPFHWFIKAPKINKFFIWDIYSRFSIIFTERKSLTFYVGSDWVRWWIPNGEEDTKNWKEGKIINSPEIYKINGSKIHDFDDDLGHVILENGERLKFIVGGACWYKKSDPEGVFLREGVVAVMIAPNDTYAWGHLKRLKYN